MSEQFLTLDLLSETKAAAAQRQLSDGLATTKLLRSLIMVDPNIAAPTRGGKITPALSTFLVSDGAARRYRRARQALLDRLPGSGDTISIEDATAVLDWHDPSAVVEILHLVDRGMVVADFRDLGVGDRTIVLRRL